MALENCWGREYNSNNPDPNTKEYRKKCCIPCEPGEYLDEMTNQCVNCPAGFACSSTAREIFSKIILYLFSS